MEGTGLGESDSDRRRGLSAVIEPWHRGIDPVSVEVLCSNGLHKITWRDGDLILEDHDVAAEQAVRGLGGELPECLEVLEAWNAEWSVADGVNPLTRVPSWIPGMSREEWLSRSKGLEDNLRLAQSHLARLKKSLNQSYYTSVLLQLPAELRELFNMDLVAHALSVIEENPAVRTLESRQLLEQPLATRANSALEEGMRAWRRVGDYAILTTESWLIGEDEEPSILGWMSASGGFAAASLPFGWLTTLYARGAHLVDGCFVLEAHDADDTATNIRVTAVRWERATTSAPVEGSGMPGYEMQEDRLDKHYKDRWVPIPAEAMISRREGCWRLSWL